ncbi:MAG: shikimate kinase [Pseudomonadota bacterium]
MIVALIGYRCTGKTSLGKGLAARLCWRFVDSDAFIEQKAGKSIDEIVSQGGWPLFREMEKEAIKELVALDHVVLATGGGAVLAQGNVQLLQEQGVVVWLKADAQTIRDRMLADPKTILQRPGLTSQGALDEIETVLAERTSIYEKAAHIILDTSVKPVSWLSEEALVLLYNNQMAKERLFRE